jgi:23S rRNA (guanine745-N1)-methyltransferase
VLADVVAALVCPVCRETLSEVVGGLACAGGHRFDAARQGYVNLAGGLGRASLGADDAAQVAARVNFLTGDHFSHVMAALVDLAAPAWPGEGLVVDAGSGPGHYLAAVLDAVPDATGLAVDASAAALRRAARAHPRAAAIGWDLREPWPLREASAGLILDLFAPRNAEEFARVLRPDGALLVVVPGPDHLTELVSALGLLTVDPDKEERLEATLGGHFVLDTERRVRRHIFLTPRQIESLVAMGPSAKRHGHVGSGADSTAVTIDVRVRQYRPR